MMRTDQTEGTARGFDALRKFARKPERRVEHCELCHGELFHEHPHLVELTQRRIICSCEACAMLFTGRVGSKYQRVPRQVRLLADFRMTDAEWDGLMIPINLAFFFQSSADSRVSALYPSPAGATESLLPLAAWNNIVESNLVLKGLEPDVEALLVNRVGQARGNAPAEYYMVPIDACYKLVGLIRLHWKGFSGGTEVWQEIGKFFSELRSTALIVNERVHA
ncbi:MAG TPA: DUF5947 family protein [Terriglobales bacterium]|nr:DUF5947 family protein [Terriglobales bacterium]